MAAIFSNPETGDPFRKFGSFVRKAGIRDFHVSRGFMTAVVADGDNEFAVKIRLAIVPDAAWEDITQALAQEGSFSARLFAGQMPEGIEAVFGRFQAPLFPRSPADLYFSCACSDEIAFCRHLARLYAYAGEVLEKDPFLIFILRGKAKEELLTDIRVKRPPSAGRREALAPREEENPENFWTLGVPVQELREKISAIPAKTD
jgi:uncharacterized Zn finger protein